MARELHDVAGHKLTALREGHGLTGMRERIAALVRAGLRLLAGGYFNKEIARSLFLAEGTVKNCVSEILDKLGTRDRTRAVLKAITLRII